MVFALIKRIAIDKKPEAPVKKEFKMQNPFSGLLFCSVCGKRIGRTTMSQRSGNPARLRCVNGRNCHNGSAYFEIVEKEIIDALRSWLKGYKVKIDTVGYAEDIKLGKKRLQKLEQEKEKLTAQLDNAFNLVEQGVYTLEVFQSRRAKLTLSMEDLDMQIEKLQEEILALETSETTQQSLIPQTEELLASYDAMTNEERNALLKEILEEIKYYKGADGQIEIDLYPRLPQL